MKTNRTTSRYLLFLSSILLICSCSKISFEDDKENLKSGDVIWVHDIYILKENELHLVTDYQMQLSSSNETITQSIFLRGSWDRINLFPDQADWIHLSSETTQNSVSFPLKDADGKVEMLTGHIITLNVETERNTSRKKRSSKVRVLLSPPPGESVFVYGTEFYICQDGAAK